jgi:hypothetical protein
MVDTLSTGEAHLFRIHPAADSGPPRSQLVSDIATVAF